MKRNLDICQDCKRFGWYKEYDGKSFVCDHDFRASHSKSAFENREVPVGCDNMLEYLMDSECAVSSIGRASPSSSIPSNEGCVGKGGG
jgi:hypothetical protein